VAIAVTVVAPVAAPGLQSSRIASARLSVKDARLKPVQNGLDLSSTLFLISHLNFSAMDEEDSYCSRQIKEESEH
jgi:hypothetical protein